MHGTTCMNFVGYLILHSEHGCVVSYKVFSSHVLHLLSFPFPLFGSKPLFSILLIWTGPKWTPCERRRALFLILWLLYKTVNVLGKALQKYVFGLYLLLAFLPFVDGPRAPEMAGYYPRDEERPGYAAVRDTQALSASYERFLRSGVYIIFFLHNHFLNYTLS